MRRIFNNDQDENDKDSKAVKDPKKEGYAKEDYRLCRVMNECIYI